MIMKNVGVISNRLTDYTYVEYVLYTSVRFSQKSNYTKVIIIRALQREKEMP